MRYALLDLDKVVVNIIEAEPDFAESIGAVLIEDSRVTMGHYLRDGVFYEIVEGVETEVFRVPIEYSEMDLLKQKLAILQEQSAQQQALIDAILGVSE